MNRAIFVLQTSAIHHQRDEVGVDADEVFEVGWIAEHVRLDRRIGGDLDGLADQAGILVAAWSGAQADWPATPMGATVTATMATSGATIARTRRVIWGRRRLTCVYLLDNSFPANAEGTAPSASRDWSKRTNMGGSL